MMRRIEGLGFEGLGYFYQLARLKQRFRERLPGSEVFISTGLGPGQSLSLGFRVNE